MSPRTLQRPIEREPSQSVEKCVQNLKTMPRIACEQNFWTCFRRILPVCSLPLFGNSVQCMSAVTKHWTHPKRVPKQTSFENIKFSKLKKLAILIPYAFWYPLRGAAKRDTQTGTKTNGYQNAWFSEIKKLGALLNQRFRREAQLLRIARIRSRPGKGRAKTKSSWISPIFVNSGVGNQPRCTSNFCSNLPPGKVHELWPFFGLVCWGYSWKKSLPFDRKLLHN